MFSLLLKELIFIFLFITIIILCFQIGKQGRLRSDCMEKQSNQVLHPLPFHLHFLDNFSMRTLRRPLCSNCECPKFDFYGLLQFQSSAKSCNVSLSGLCEGKPVDFKMEFTVPTESELNESAKSCNVCLFSVRVSQWTSRWSLPCQHS